jgi:hypothetical protein
MKNSLKILLIGILFVSLLACNLTSPKTKSPANSITESMPQETATPEAQASQAGACANPLYPVKQGATWTYETSGGPTGPSSYTDTISDVRADGFTLSSKFGDSLNRTQEWACNPDGLLALQLGGQAAMLSTNNLQAQITTSNPKGVTFPANPISTGDEWTYSMDFEGQVKVEGGVENTVNGTVTFQFKALGPESVTVPAGSFDAMKIQVDTTFDMKASVQGLQVPLTVNDTSITWMAPDVGMVKSSDTVDSSLYSGTFDIQLQSYNIP